MALSLAACGGSSTPAVEEPAPVEPDPVGVSLELTTAQNIFTDLTAQADAITGTQATMTAVDVIVDDVAGDADTLTIASNGAAMTFGTVSGIENIVVNVTAFGAANAIDVTGVADGTITVNNLQLLGSTDASVAGAGNVTVVAGTGVTGDLAVTIEEDAAAVVNSGSAATVTLTSNGGADQTASVVVGGAEVGVEIAAGDITTLALSAAAAAATLITDTAGNLTAVTADANTTVALADIADFETIVTTGAATIAGAATTGADLSDYTSITFVDETEVGGVTNADATAYTIASGATVSLNTTNDTLSFTVADADDGVVGAAAPVESTLNISLDENTVSVDLVDDAGDGDDYIATVNIVANVAQTAFALTVDGDVAISVSGAEDVVMSVTQGAAGASTLNASALAGALTVSATADLLEITGGAGDDEITAFTAVAFDLDGGAGSNTLVTAADMQSGTFTNFAVIDDGNGAGGADFLTSQLDGLDAILATGSAIVTSVIDSASVNFSGLLVADGVAGAGVDMTGAAVDAVNVLVGQAISVTGTAAVDVLVGATGDDTISGGAGDDTITGDDGADTVTGGAGADIFVFVDGNSGITAATADVITDFSTAAADADTLDIDGYTAANAATDLSIVDGSALADFAALVAQADAAYANDITDGVHVAYNAMGTGDAYVLVDADGSGAFGAGDTLIILTGVNAAAEIVAADFV